jgi:type I restriction enzyme R subunit
MTRGLTVAGGDRLGKTILFAKNQHHAEFIAERFNANYPHHKGEFARVITFKTEYAQSLIDNFSAKDKAPTSPSRWTCSTPESTCPRS